MSRRGFGIPETLIGIVIISAAALLLNQVTSQMGSSAHRTRLTSTMIQIQSSVAAATMDGDNYSDPAVKASLKGGTVPADFRLNYPVSPPFLVGHIGAPVDFDINGDPCAGYGKGDCLIRVEFDIKNLNSDLKTKDAAGNVVAAVPRFGAAYRITAFQADKKSGPIAPLGTSHTHAFDLPVDANHLGDYGFRIPTDLYAKQGSSTCDPASELFVRGIYKYTGNVVCLKKPTPADRCPDGTISRGFKLAGDNNDRLVLKCETVHQATCPDNYLLNRLDFASLQEGRNPDGSCVFVTKDVVPGHLPGNAPVETQDSACALLCPNFYKLEAVTCVVVNQQNVGNCDIPKTADHAASNNHVADENPNAVVCNCTMADRTATCTAPTLLHVGPFEGCDAKSKGRVRITGGSCRLIPNSVEAAQ